MFGSQFVGFVALLAGIIALAGCQSTSSPPIGAAAAKKIAARPVTDGWQPNEAAGPSPYDGTPIRSGVSPDGLNYHYNRDARAEIGNWRIGCQRDKMTDARSCDLLSNSTLLRIFTDEKGEASMVCIAGHDFPGRRGAIRLDKNPPIPTNEKGCLPASQIVSSLRTARLATTRHVSWPYDVAKDVEGNVIGLASALDLTRFMAQRIDGLTF